MSTTKEELVQGLLDAWGDQYQSWWARQSPEKLKRIQNRTGMLKHGLSTIAPLKCQGPKTCPFFHSCPIPDDPQKPGPLSDYPVNMPCVLEANYVGQRVIDYVEQLKVDPGDPVEMSLINELALLDLLKNRAVLILSGGDRLGQGRDMLAVDELVVGWDDDGNPRTTTQTRVHPAIEIMEKHEKRRTKILDKFLATRESRVKVYGGNQDTHSRLQADIENIKRFVETLGQKQLSVTPDEEEPIRLEVVEIA